MTSRKERTWSLTSRTTRSRGGLGRPPRRKVGFLGLTLSDAAKWAVIMTGAGTIALAAVAMIEKEIIPNPFQNQPTNEKVAAPVLQSTDQTHEVCAEGEYSKTAYFSLVDVSDPFASASERNRILRAASDDMHSVDRGAWVGIAGLTDNHREPVEVVGEGCNPGRGDEANWINENRRQVQNTYDAFMQQADFNLATLFTPEDKNATPLCEGIAVLSLQPAMINADRKIITVTSDLMYHIEGGPTVYRGSDSFYTSFPDRCQVDLSGVELNFIIIPRDHPNQTERLINYWVETYRSMGASVHFRYR